MRQSMKSVFGFSPTVVYGRTIIGPLYLLMISASSRLASAFTSAASRRKARSVLKNMKLTYWRWRDGSLFCAGCACGSTVAVMVSGFYRIALAATPPGADFQCPPVETENEICQVHKT